MGESTSGQKRTVHFFNCASVGEVGFKDTKAYKVRSVTLKSLPMAYLLVCRDLSAFDSLYLCKHSSCLLKILSRTSKGKELKTLYNRN